MKTQVAFQGCLFGAGVSDMLSVLARNWHRLYKKKVTLFCPKAVLGVQDNFKTAIPKLSNAQLLSTVRTDEKSEFLSASCPTVGKDCIHWEIHKFFSASFVLQKKQFRTHTHTCFAACLMIRFFWLKIWVTVRMGCQWIQKEILGPLDT